MGTNSIIHFYVMSCVVCSVVVSAAATPSDNQNLIDTIRTLKEQMNALLDRRQQDFNILEESIRRSLDKNSQLASIKTDLEELRREVVKLKGGKKPTLNEQKNDHLTVQWLSTAVSELRAELAEVSSNFNSSVEIQQRQEMVSGLDLLRGDVASFRRDLEELRAEQQQTVVTLGQLKQDVETSVKTSEIALTSTSATKALMDEVKAEMTSFAKSLTKLTRDVKLLKVSAAQVRKDESVSSSNGFLLKDLTTASDKKYRHNHLLRQEIMKVEKWGEKIEERHNRLSRIVHRIEKQMKVNCLKSDDSRSNEIIDERLSERVKRLEEADRSNLKQVFNISRQVSELSRLHMSMLQLMESVENLEAKLDKNVPELQREISKMEFGMAQATSSISLLKQNQETQRSTVKALTESVSRVEDRLDTDHGHLSSLQAQILNLTNWSREKNESTDVQREEIQDSRLAALEEKLEEHLEDDLPPTAGPPSLNGAHNGTTLPELIESLKTVQKEYDNIVHQLPHDCGSVNGGSGIYAIAPGEGPPLLVACDMSSGPGGWNIVQRRIDGSQEFNRKWKEYAEGFGTPSGEFWLGNEALHRLTSENCSSLRIDFTDIYGKKWVAEYEGFHISGLEDGYRIHVFGYSGNASDALEYQNKMQFSAVDSDRDISNTHCAQNYEGGWWFSHCQHANLNGRYNLGLTWFDGTRNEWIAVAFSEMKVRRRRNCLT